MAKANAPTYTTPLPKVTITFTNSNGKRTIDGFAGLTWTATQNLGDESLTVQITPAEYLANPQIYLYGTTVELKDSTGYSIWAGYLEVPVPADDHVPLVAHGFGTILDYAQPFGSNNAILLQTMDLSIWQDTNQAPFNIPNHNDSLGSHITPDGYIRWLYSAQQNPPGGIDGMAFPLPGLTIKRFALFSGNPAPGAGTLFFWQIWQVCSLAPDYQYWFRNAHDGYDTAVRPGIFTAYEQNYSVTTVQNSDQFGQHHPAWDYKAPDGGYPARNQPYDTIVFVLGGTGGANGGGVANATNLRFNGTITQADTYNASAALTFLGQQMGWDTSGIVSSGINILPYYLEDGGPWADAATYFAAITGGTWGAHGLINKKPALYAIVYPTDKNDTNTWTVARSDPANADLQPSSDYFNVVKVRYTDWAGSPQVVTQTADPNSQAGQDFARLGWNRVFDFGLSGAYPPQGFKLPNGQDVVSTKTPQNVGKALLKSYSVNRPNGNITGLYGLNQGAVYPLWRVVPGSAVFVKEDSNEPGKGLYLVQSVTGYEDHVELGVGSARPLVDQQIAQAARDAARGADRFSQ